AAGLSIDHLGFATTFIGFALLPLLSVLVLTRRALALPGRHRAHAQAPSGGIIQLMRNPQLKRVFIVNALLSMAWDLHTFFIPIYGATIGLSASRIGVILASFAAATFALFPFVASAEALMVLSFALGLALGSAQPMVMALLHSIAPAGRMGEA